MVIMKVLIRESEYNSTSKIDRVGAVTEFVVSILDESLYEIEEINPQALSCYYVEYYDLQVSEFGLAEFLKNNCSNVFVLDGINEGLTAIGASAHQEIFKQACEVLNELDKEVFEEFADSDEENLDGEFKNELTATYSTLNSLSKEFFKLEESPQALHELAYDFIATIKELTLVKDDEYENELRKLIASVPDFEERLRKAEEEDEDDWLEDDEFVSVIVDICEKFNINLLSIDEVNFGDEIVSDEQVAINEEKEIVYYHINTDQGEFYVIKDENQATLVAKNNGEPKGSISIH